MKKIIYTLMFGAMAHVALAQCSKTYNATGVYPSSLPAAWEQIAYTQELDFTFPADTTIQGFSVHIDSMKVKSLSGFPGTQFNYSCGNASCMYLPNTAAKFQGCFFVSGTPPKGSAGNYKLYVELEAYIQTPFGPQVYPIQDSSVTFSVNACSLSATILAGSNMLCNGATTNLSGTGNGTFKWYLNGVLKDSGVSITSGLTGSWWAILKDSVGCTDTSNVIQIGNYPIPVKPQLIQNTGTNDVVCNISGKAYSWRNNGVADTALNGKKTITIAKDGYYQVSYQDSNGCWSAWSDSLNVKYMGVGLISGRQACIYPNPASEKLYIRLMEFSAGTGQVCLLNVSGQVLKKIQFLNQTEEVSLSDLPDGIYFISISDANGSSVLKFSVVR